MQKLLTLALLSLTLAPFPSAAFYTTDNFTLAGEHVAPASFSADGAGGFFGTTEDGRTFTQQPLGADFGVKLHKFVIDDAFFYICKHGAFKASGDLAAISICLSQS